VPRLAEPLQPDEHAAAYEAAIAEQVRRTFGLEARPAQLTLIRRTLEGQNSLGVMPTGSGKSLAFQAAAVLLGASGKTVLVVSPLVSLMRDQVQKLQQLLRAERLDSTLERAESEDILRRLAARELALLYVAPERLANERFRHALGRADVGAVAVDEAHCISAWGHDFRPDYLRLPILIDQLGGPPTLALTAMAPPAVQRDICADLRIPPDGLVNTGARRPNLALSVEVVPDAQRTARTIELVAREPDAPTIVYALRQSDTEALATQLARAGVRADAYHAGLAAEKRSEVQDRFLVNDLACIVATVAFGMGVDKPDVRRIVHAHAPRSLEGYVQEVGRAGRDGLPATATLLYDESDQAALANFVEAKAPSAQQVRDVLNAAFAPANRETSDTIAYSPQRVGDAHDVDPVAVRTLFARLERRGVVAALTPAFDEYQVALASGPDAAATQLGQEDGQAWLALVNAGKRGRTWLTISVSDAVETTGLPYPTLRRVLRRVEEDGLLEVRASGALQRYRVLRRPEPGEDLPALTASVEQGIEGERRRLTAVRSYVLERGCRQAHALAYLGEADLTACGVCDLCRGGAPVLQGDLTVRGWRAGFDPAVAREMAALESQRGEPDAVGIARALCQVLTPRSRPYRRHPAWGSLERAPFAEVLAAVRDALGGA
jgi:ATP-dependent DNA helicase RecQ